MFLKKQSNNVMINYEIFSYEWYIWIQMLQAMPQLLDACFSRNHNITSPCMHFSLFASMSIPSVSINITVKIIYFQFEVLMAVNIAITVLQDVRLCVLGGYQGFGETCYVLVQDNDKDVGSMIIPNLGICQPENIGNVPEDCDHKHTLSFSWINTIQSFKLVKCLSAIT
jgi:hypothetical protein